MTTAPRRPEAPRLDLDDALNIRARFAEGTSARALASEYGVSLASVYAVLREESHRCVVRTVLAPAVFVRLTETAQRVGRTREEVAAALVARALASVSPPRQ